MDTLGRTLKSPIQKLHYSRVHDQSPKLRIQESGSFCDTLIRQVQNSRFATALSVLGVGKRFADFPARGGSTSETERDGEIVDERRGDRLTLTTFWVTIEIGMRPKLF